MLHHPTLPLPYANHTRYDDYEHLKAELEQEKRYRETIEWSNTELERSITELETYLRELDENGKGADDNEWKVRFESQTALNKQFQEQKDWLEAELLEARRKLTTGSYPEAMNYNLDVLNEPELLRLVKHLERMRNDYYSTLRDAEWKLDKESKEFHHFDEMRRVYRAEVKHANATIDRMRLSRVLDPNGIVSPIYPPGYFRWLDTHTPVAGGSRGVSYGDGGGGGGGGGGSKKGAVRKGGGKGNEGKLDREPSPPPPPRSKSRNDKKSKKKEAPPEVPEERPVSETDNGNATDVSGGDQEAPEKTSNVSSGAESFAKEDVKRSNSKKREEKQSRSQRED